MSRNFNCDFKDLPPELQQELIELKKQAEKILNSKAGKRILAKAKKHKKLEYREKHPKCKWCKWYNYHTVPLGMSMSGYDECLLKDKMLRFTNYRTFCKYYEVKEKTNEISIDKTDE